ncbi:MAG: ribosome recycling factor [Brevinematales bacterium]|nr:ribosome recycling factor [Brevinematales bacterium]
MKGKDDSKEVKKEFNFNQVKEEIKKHFEDSLNVYKEEIKKIRTGRASTIIIEDIKVDYYNNLTPIKQLATISVSDASTLVISPWDKSVLKNIEKSLISSNLGLSISSDGSNIKVHFPPLTEERKKEIIKFLHTKAEEAKVAIRNIRHKYLKNVREAKETAHISEDTEKRYEQEIDKITHEYIEKIDSLTKTKEKEIMEV